MAFSDLWAVFYTWYVILCLFLSLC